MMRFVTRARLCVTHPHSRMHARRGAQIQVMGAYVLARFVFALPRPERFSARDPLHKKKGKDAADLKDAAKKIRSTTTKAIEVRRSPCAWVAVDVACTRAD